MQMRPFNLLSGCAAAGIALAFALVSPNSAGAAPLPCALKDGAPKQDAQTPAPARRLRVTDVRDGVVHLADGTRLVPAGARMPTHLHPAPGLADAAERAARAVLLGHLVEITGPERDRFARYIAPARLFGDAGNGDAGNEGADLAQALVRAGAAYALPSALPASATACGPALMAAEAEARAARRGLWAVDGAVVSPSDTAGLAARAGLFTVAEGRLVRANLTRDRLYLNFGRDWRVNLTATGNRRMAVMFSRNGLGPATLMTRVEGGTFTERQPEPGTVAPDAGVTDVPAHGPFAQGSYAQVRGIIALERGPVLALQSPQDLVWQPVAPRAAGRTSTGSGTERRGRGGPREEESK